MVWREPYWIRRVCEDGPIFGCGPCHGVRLAAGPAILRERAVSALMLALPGHLRPSSDCGIWHHAASTRLVPVLVAGLGVRALRWTESPQECSYMMAFAVAARLGLAINGACQCPAIT